MGKYTKIPADSFEKLQLNAGILLRRFEPKTATVTESDIIGATSGGINFTAVPTYSDFGEDIDNCPKNMKELKRIESWEVKLAGSFVTVDPAAAKTMIGAADVDESDPTKVTPRNDVAAGDFEELWLVADYGTGGDGFVAVHMLNALSTGGFNLQTTDKAKGAFEFEFTGHYSMDAQDKVPFEVYIDGKVAALEAKEAKR